MYAATLMSELQQAGCDVIAVCKPQSKIEAYLLSRGIRCEHLPVYKKISPASLKYIAGLLRRHNVDVVHVHFHTDIWMASLALRHNRQIRLFLSIYMGVIKKNDILHRWIYRRVDTFFTSSSELNRRLPDLYPISKEKIRYLSYGRRLDLYSSNDAERKAVRSRFGIRDTELLVGTMVRVDPGKGVIDFARSFLYLAEEQRQNVKYLIIGEPTRKGSAKPGESPFEPHCVEYLREIEEYVQQHKLEDNILFAGYQEDAITFLRGMDVFVFPSRDELYSLVMLDAMAMGLPVVAARAGGNLLQVDDGRNGLLYTVGDSRDLASNITRYLTHPDERLRHGAAAQQFVGEHHDMNATVAQLMELYQQERIS